MDLHLLPAHSASIRPCEWPVSPNSRDVKQPPAWEWLYAGRGCKGSAPIIPKTSPQSRTLFAR